MSNNKTQQKTRRETLKNPYETRDDNVVSTIKKATIDEISKDWKIAMAQMLEIGKNNKKQNESGDLQEGEELIFSQKEKRTNVEPAINYTAEIIHAERRTLGENNKQINEKIEMLRIEIAKLAKSSKQLEVMVRDVSIERVGPNPGKYHLNFFEWVLATIQAARLRVEESANWLSTVSSKSRKRDYWSLSKKHGTSYMLSGERVVSQQTG